MPNLANIENPTEDQEQEAFVQWLRLKGYPHFRVPNETYTRSWSQKAKNKKLGVSSGVAIEMKRKKGGVTSANQKQWIKTLNESGVQTVVCKGCDTAIEFVESITKP